MACWSASAFSAIRQFSRTPPGRRAPGRRRRGGQRAAAWVISVIALPVTRRMFQSTAGSSRRTADFCHSRRPAAGSAGNDRPARSRERSRGRPLHPLCTRSEAIVADAGARRLPCHERTPSLAKDRTIQTATRQSRAPTIPDERNATFLSRGRSPRHGVAFASGARRLGYRYATRGEPDRPSSTLRSLGGPSQLAHAKQLPSDHPLTTRVDRVSPSRLTAEPPGSLRHTTGGPVGDGFAAR
jgi:hypothetical protein